MNLRSFNIAASNRSMVFDQIESLNRRAVRLNLEPIFMNCGKPFVDSKGNFMITVELYGSLDVSFDGWQFIATLQHLPTGDNIVRPITDEYDVPLEYRSSGSVCEHCKINRYRKDTYVVRHVSGKFNQVGSTCIKDFLGGNSPDNIMKRADLVGELVSFMHGASIGTNDEGIIPIIRCLEQTSAIIRKYGWLSKAAANKAGGIPTATRLSDHYSAYGSKYDRIEINDDDRNKAKLAMEWAENLSEEEVAPSEYIYNIRAIARSGMVDFRTMGYCASIVSSYEHSLSKNTVAKTSEYVGNIKQRLDFKVKLKSSKSGTSEYGQYYKYIFKDSNDNVLVWIASIDHSLQENKQYSIRGTVKAHSEWKGTRETIITRCEILNMIGDTNA